MIFLFVKNEFIVCFCAKSLVLNLKNEYVMATLVYLSRQNPVTDHNLRKLKIFEMTCDVPQSKHHIIFEARLKSI